MASGGGAELLALEIAKAGRAAAQFDRELRDLIRRMSRENPLWGAPRIDGELLKLGFELAELTVSKYMIGGSDVRPPRAGGRSCAITRGRSPRSICAWFRPCTSNACLPL